MTDREIMQMALDALEEIGDQWGFTSKRTIPKRIKAIEALVARLAKEKPKPVLVTPYEFVKAVKGKEDIRGIPVMMSVWPTDEKNDVVPKKSQPEPPCKTGSQCVGGKCLRCAEPEPVAWTTDLSFDYDTEIIPANDKGKLGTNINDIPLYTAPPQREWQGLTDEEAKKVFEKHNCTISADLAGILARAIEAKLKEKNNG